MPDPLWSSQLPTVVKCPDCNEPVPILELGGHVCTGNTRFDDPASITSLNPSPIRGEIEHEATNRIPSPGLRPLSRQEYPLHEETITDAISSASGSVGSKPQTWDCSSYHPTVEYYQPDGSVESWNASLVDSTVSPPFLHLRCIDNTPTRASQVFPSLGPSHGYQSTTPMKTTRRDTRGRLWWLMKTTTSSPP